MARRRELKGVCDGLLGNFIGRYNAIGGYWALGFFQKHLCENRLKSLVFQLVPADAPADEFPFLLTLDYFRQAMHSLLEGNKIPLEWVSQAKLSVISLSDDTLDCRCTITTDIGTEFISNARLLVRPHDRSREFRSGGNQGPSNFRRNSQRL